MTFHFKSKQIISGEASTYVASNTRTSKQCWLQEFLEWEEETQSWKVCI